MKQSIIFAAVVSAGSFFATAPFARATSVATSAANGTLATDGWFFGEFTNPANSSGFSAFTQVTPPAPGGTPTVGGYPLGSDSLVEWSNNAAGSDPNVIFNAGATDLNTSSMSPSYGDIDFKAGTINLGPFQGPTVVQYNVSENGIYNISSDFQTVQEANSAPMEYVYIPGVNTYSKQLVDAGNAQFGTASSYDVSGVYLFAGDVIDFVAWGNNSDNKTTQLSASVENVDPNASPSLGASPTIAVPLPKSAGVGFGMLGGIGLLAGLRKRTSRRREIA